MKRYSLKSIEPSGRDDLPWKVTMQTPSGPSIYYSSGEPSDIEASAKASIARMNRVHCLHGNMIQKIMNLKTD